MLRMFGPGTKDTPADLNCAGAELSKAVWIDLIEPTREEERLVEQLIGTNVPTREEMQEIEPSSRLYQRNGATFMGVLPLQFQEGEGATTLGLDGSETYSIDGIASLEPRQEVAVQVTRADGSTQMITARCRIDTYNELEYYRSGGILHYVLRNLAS